MKPTRMLFGILAVGFVALGITQIKGRKVIEEDQAHQIALAKLGAGKVRFSERRRDRARTIYEVYVTRNDTLLRVVVDGATSAVDTVMVDAENSRSRLQARLIAKKRAETAALAAVPGEVARWKIKNNGDNWFYRFFIETSDGKLKEVYVDGDNFKVVRVREIKTPAKT